MDPAFEVHVLNEEGILKARQVAFLFNDLLNALDSPEIVGIGKGRERSIVVTKLEEACFFAKKGLANQSENQK